MSGSAAPSRVVIGVIDDGIAFAHERFRTFAAGSDKTRVEAWWLQDGPYQGAASPVPYGRELRKGDIDARLAACTRGGTLDEDLLYRRAGLIDFRRYGHKSAAWRAAHGTHVADLACGFDPAHAPSDRPIVFVQLPVRVTAATSGASLTPYVVDAMVYILHRAAQLSATSGAGPLPVVINLSYGRLAGPHDGTRAFDAAVDALVAHSAARGVALRVVLPAGNSYLARCHAQVSFQRVNQVVPLRWRVLPDDQTPSFLDIWLPPGGGASSGSPLELTIVSPTGESRTIDAVSGPVFWGAGPDVFADARYRVAAASGRGRFRISLKPTVDLDPTVALAPAGVWTVKLKNKGVPRGAVVQAWIERDDSLHGFPERGRQSYFDDAAYVRHDHAGRDKETDDAASVVRREGTINGMATGRNTIVAGGYIQKDMAAAPYSAAGRQHPPGPPPRAPDAMAVSEYSRVHAGIIAAGALSGSRVTIGGTSVAAPQLARLSADELAAGKAGDRNGVQAQAATDEAGYPAGTPPRPAGARSGAGRLKPVRRRGPER